MRKLSDFELEQIEGGSFWGGLACGLGVTLLLSGVGTAVGAIAVASGCIGALFY